MFSTGLSSGDFGGMGRIVISPRKARGKAGSARREQTRSLRKWKVTSLIAAMNNSPQTDAMVRMSKLMKDFLGSYMTKSPCSRFNDAIRRRTSPCGQVLKCSESGRGQYPSWFEPSNLSSEQGQELRSDLPAAERYV